MFELKGKEFNIGNSQKEFEFIIFEVIQYYSEKGFVITKDIQMYTFEKKSSFFTSGEKFYLNIFTKENRYFANIILPQKILNRVYLYIVLFTLGILKVCGFELDCFFDSGVLFFYFLGLLVFIAILSIKIYSRISSVNKMFSKIILYTYEKNNIPIGESA